MTPDALQSLYGDVFSEWVRELDLVARDTPDASALP